MKSGFHIGSHTNHSLENVDDKGMTIKKIVGFFAENIVLTFFYAYGVMRKFQKFRKIT